MLELLLETSQEVQDITRALGAAEQLMKLTPDEPDLTLLLAGLYAVNVYPALTLRMFQRFVERWPEDEHAAEVRETITLLTVSLEELVGEVGLGDDGMELASLHEQAQALSAQGKYEEARKVARQLLARRPHFAPALNNISQAYYAEGRLDQAMATAQSVLEFEPDNVHALSNLSRFACLSGRMEEAQRLAEQLKASRAGGFERDYKVAEALTYLGDDAGVLEAFNRANKARELDAADDLFYHLAAVASLRLNRAAEARRLWKRALELSPDLDLAQDNFADLDLPAEERNGPWGFSFANWMTVKSSRVHSTEASLGGDGKMQRDPASVPSG